jgi:uncharacterized protein (TIGR03000 family)
MFRVNRMQRASAKGGTVMFRTTQKLGGILILAAAMLLVTPSPGQAQRGYRGGNYRYGANRYYGGYYNNAPYGTYPYYGNYGANYDIPYYDALGTTENPGYDTVTRYYLGGPTPPNPSADTSYYPPSGIPARLTVKVPADALIWFDSEQMKSTGPVRTYNTLPLPPGQFTYDITARWTDNGRAVTQTKQVIVSPGALVEVDFRAQPDGAAKIPATRAR